MYKFIFAYGLHLHCCAYVPKIEGAELLIDSSWVLLVKDLLIELLLKARIPVVFPVM